MSPDGACATVRLRGKATEGTPLYVPSGTPRSSFPGVRDVLPLECTCELATLLPRSSLVMTAHAGHPPFV